MPFDRRFLNPVWVIRRSFGRISGADLRYWRNRAAELHSQLETSQQQCQAALDELHALFESRDRRLHPFVNEALATLNLRQPGLYRIAFDSSGEVDQPGELSQLFTSFGSDKETRHNYGHVYEGLLASAGENPRIFEIGLGSLNAFAYAGLPPGGSIKAWRTRFPEGTVVGADIDPESVQVVDTPAFVMDQTSDTSLANARAKLSADEQFDLIVDDGFHDPHANVRTMKTLFDLLKPGGFYVVEDIHESLIDYWLAIAPHLPGDSYLLDLRNDRPDTDDNVLFISRAV